jgi:osmotically-inducible protein OsmY
MGSENRIKQRHCRSSQRRRGDTFRFAHSYWDKDAAEQAAKRVYGVRGVTNDIEVKPSSKRTDPEIARDAVHELESHVSLPSDKIKVTVKNGWVTLEGNVDWQYQKTLAESAVKKLRGVIGIINNIEVNPKVTCMSTDFASILPPRWPAANLA